jgi:hypothetical protein
MDKTALRDHVKEMVMVIAKDLDTPQTELEQTDRQVKRPGNSEDKGTGL